MAKRRKLQLDYGSTSGRSFDKLVSVVAATVPYHRSVAEYHAGKRAKAGFLAAAAALLVPLFLACGSGATSTPPPSSTGASTPNKPVATATIKPSPTTQNPSLPTPESTYTLKDTPTTTTAPANTVIPPTLSTSTPEPATPIPPTEHTPTSTPKPINIPNSPTVTPVPPTQIPPTVTPVPPTQIPPTVTPVPMPDLQITDTTSTYLGVNDDGTTSYSLKFKGTVGQIEPGEPFSVEVLGLEGILDNPILPFTEINADGTFTLELPEVKLPDVGGKIYNISATADSGKVITELNEGNNESETYVLEVKEAPTYTRDEWEYFKELAFKRGDGTPKNLTKFVKPIEIMIFGEPTQEQLDYLDAKIKIAQESGFDVQYALADSVRSNYMAHLNVDRSELPVIFPRGNPARLGNATGIAFHRERNNEIIDCTIAVVKLNPGDPAFYFLNTTSEEFFQCITGLDFDGSSSHPESIISYGRHQYFVDPLPDIDLRVLRLAGEDVLKPGMTEQQVRTHIRVVDQL